MARSGTPPTVSSLLEDRDLIAVDRDALRPLAERAQMRGIDLKLKRIIGVSNVLSQETRALCHEAFGARVIDQYEAGVTIAGTLARTYRDDTARQAAIEKAVGRLIDGAD